MSNTNATKAYEQTVEKARGVGQSAAELASAVGRQAVDTASAVGQKAVEKADDATAAVGGGIKHLAGAIREKTPDSGVIGNVAGTVADTLETGGRYLEEKQVSGMAKDATEMIRNHPVPAILLAIGLGFFLARMTRTNRSS